MLMLIGRRLLVAIPLVLGVSLVIFLLAELVPGSAAATILGQNATPESVAALQAQLGLDDPWYVRYWEWVVGLVHGDLGTSLFTGEPVTTTLNTRLGVTLSLVVLSLIGAALVGMALGLISALRGGVLARALDVLSLAGLALPNFLVALVLVAVFAVKLRWFPATGYVPLVDSATGWFSSLVLPVVALALVGLAAIAKQTRDSALDVLESEHIQVLRANGLPEWSVVLKHVLRNASIPVVTVIGLLTVGLLDGTVFVETVFALPGLGSAATLATRSHDVSVLLGVGVYFTVITVLVNLVVDLLYGLLNPKVRVS